MLEKLFGSKSRVKLLFLFFRNQNKSFFVREITRKLNLQINAIRRELANLEDIGIIKIDNSHEGEGGGVEKKYYQIDKDYVLFEELKTLLVKSQLLLRHEFLEKISKSPDVAYLLLTGIFTGDRTSLRTDMLVVGSITKEKLNKLIEAFESDIGYSINFTLMSADEFQYRKDVTDKFLYEILESKKIVAIDKINNQL